jgi:hypothetical protein
MPEIFKITPLEFEEQLKKEAIVSGITIHTKRI